MTLADEDTNSTYLIFVTDTDTDTDILLQKVLFFEIYAVFRKIGLLQFTCYCVEKILAKISDRGEKMNIKTPKRMFEALCKLGYTF